MSGLERRTTAELYASDLERLKAKQRRISADRDTWVPMFEIIRELINAAEAPEEGA